jgi:hypothetical protein
MSLAPKPATRILDSIVLTAGGPDGTASGFLYALASDGALITLAAIGTKTIGGGITTVTTTGPCSLWLTDKKGKTVSTIYGRSSIRNWYSDSHKSGAQFCP